MRRAGMRCRQAEGDPSLGRPGCYEPLVRCDVAGWGQLIDRLRKSLGELLQQLLRT
jgi:hypothetical protein